MTGLSAATPILPVRDLAVSVDYYVRVLGFEVEWQTPGVIAAVVRDKCELFLVEGDQGHPGTWVYIGVGDAAELHGELAARGATIRQPPTNFEWGLEIQVADPDGNVLRFGSDRQKDQPLGLWLDMRGVSWRKTERGWEEAPTSGTPGAKSK